MGTLAITKSIPTHSLFCAIKNEKKITYSIKIELNFLQNKIMILQCLFSYVQSENEFPHSNKQWDDDGIHPKNVAFVATAFVCRDYSSAFTVKLFFKLTTM